MILVLLLYFLVSLTNINCIILVDNKIWSQFKRPNWAQPFTAIISNNLIYNISSTIIPLATSSKRCINRPRSIPYPFNILSYNTQEDRGHAISLDLGGANSNYNIIMQPKEWQRYYGWRKMEKWIKNTALRLYGWKKPLCANDVQYSNIHNFSLDLSLYFEYKNNKVIKINGILHYATESLIFYILPNEEVHIIQHHK